MPRPLPNIPRGPRRRRVVRPRLLFACPRVSPEWELSALSVLMKPKLHTRAAMEHQRAERAQRWDAAADDALAAAVQIVRDRLHLSVEPHRPAAGEYHFLIEFPPDQAPEFRALALLLSRRLGDLWFTLDRLFVRGGVFYRRQYGYKLNLVPATNVHLPRPIRAALRGEL